MTPIGLVSLFGTGLCVGFISGLIGIGGGVLMVPLLYLYYATPGWSPVAVDPQLQAALAHATSLFVIVPTAIRGTLVYHRSRTVDWGTALPMAIASIAAAVAGARTALLLPVPLLKLGFGFVTIAASVQLFTQRPRVVEGAGRKTWGARVIGGVATGFFSALLGVGGGLVAIPILIYVMKMPVHRVAATSLAIVAFAATAGTGAYIVSGVGGAGLPPGSLGYVDALAGLPILVGSMISVQAGVWVNRKTGTDRLRRIFAIVLLALGLQLIISNAAAVI